jgi:homoserine dehydrogenase
VGGAVTFDVCEPVGHAVKPLRIWLVGFGMVGQWLVRALDSQAERLASRYGVAVTLVGLANARHGFIYDGNGLDLPSVLALASGAGSIAEQPGVRCWPSAHRAARATEADLLVGVTASPSTDGEPGRTRAHARGAWTAHPGGDLQQMARRPARVELVALARDHGVPFCAEFTVMSGTPSLRALVDGLAGATPIALRGVR